ncbi:GNAT family N-acetyltransferase [Halomicrococcus gelatinilyticus]|uniref:GNAT family N-acetyltransferase n=1 Tax=Halomicrococcus gelatinilyticus TaxID=1702103 RepID=UPI002E148808
MDDSTVREATADDVAAIRRVARESWHAAHDDVVGPDAVERAIDEWYDVDSLAESVRRDDGLFLVAAVGVGVVGFAQAVLGDEGEPAWLARIYVDPEQWGEGVGTALLDRIEGWLRDEEADRLRLAVMAGNDVGNAFYEKRGYAVVEEREQELFGATVDDYLREKEL